MLNDNECRVKVKNKWKILQWYENPKQTNKETNIY